MPLYFLFVLCSLFCLIFPVSIYGEVGHCEYNFNKKQNKKIEMLKEWNKQWVIITSLKDKTRKQSTSVQDKL